MCLIVILMRERQITYRNFVRDSIIICLRTHAGNRITEVWKSDLYPWRRHSPVTNCEQDWAVAFHDHASSLIVHGCIPRMIFRSDQIGVISVIDIPSIWNCCALLFIEIFLFFFSSQNSIGTVFLKYFIVLYLRETQLYLAKLRFVEYPRRKAQSYY